MKNSYIRHGDDIEIVLHGRGGSRASTVIDANDLVIAEAIIGTWRVETDGKVKKYVRYNSRTQPTTYLHRIILGAPKGMSVDHIDGNPLNNRRSNLRLANASLNALNKHRARPDSLSGVRGVRFEDGRWYARIVDRGHRISLGGFATIEAASAAYQAAHAALLSKRLDEVTNASALATR